MGLNQPRSSLRISPR